MNCQIKSLFLLPSCKKIVALAAVSFCLLGVGRVQAQTTINYYNFGTAPGVAPTSIAGAGPTASAITNNFNTPGTNVNYTTGSTINAQNSDTAGEALSLRDGAMPGNNTKYIQLTTSTSGYNNIVLSYAVQRSSTGFTSEALSYSLTPDVDSSYIPVGTDSNIQTAYSLQTFDLTTVTGVNYASTIGFRLTFAGATNASGTNSIDNLTLSSTPAPPGIVSAGIGFAVTGFGALLRRRKQSKSPDTATPEAAA